eukprot:TRINITY_DN6670_c0_g1_i1.p1 TRINITY_DN6670_c0_g1~~TRINITY_DN6670_c0_g1_i1.p1  ORF type:complete len:1034 (+),score=231.46 TRINITY_DN6670_c0_g1_i1:94-3195(+)
MDWLRRKTSRVSDVGFTPCTPTDSLGGTSISIDAAGGTVSSWLQQIVREAGLKNEEACKTYALEVLEPFLVPLILQALVIMPEDPNIFVLEWLFSQLKSRIPSDIVDLFNAWHRKELGLPVSSDLDAKRPGSVGHEAAHGRQRARSHQLDQPTSASRRRASVGDMPVLERESQDPGGDASPSYASRASATPASPPLEKEAWRRRLRRMSNVMQPEEEVALEQFDVAQVREMLDDLQLFSVLSVDEREALAKVCEVRRFHEDEPLVAWGQRGHEMFIVQSGSCSVSTLQLVSTLGPGRCFGEELLFNNACSQRHIVASGATREDPLVVLCIAREKLASLNLLGRLKAQKRKRHANAVVSRSKTTTSSGPDEMAGGPSLSDEENDAGDFGTQTEEDLMKSMGASTPRRFSRSKDKTDEELAFIMDAVRQNPQLTDVLQLDEQQVRMFADMVKLTEVARGKCMCKAGEVLDHLYIVQEGVFELRESNGKPVRKLRAGEIFGDLGLLYGSASPHSVVAAIEAKAWRLSQHCLELLREANLASRRSLNLQLLCRVPILKDLDEETLIQLGDTLEEICFVGREEVLSKGSSVQHLYLVTSGSLQVGQEHTIQQGDHFGLEDMLTGKACDKAYKVSSSKATLLLLEAASLELILGATLEELAGRLSSIGAVQNSLPGCLPQQTAESEAGAAEKAGIVYERQGSKCSYERQISGGRVEVHRPPFDVPRDRLKALGVLGKGSFGLVTLQEDQESGKWYAMKAMSKGYCVEMGTTRMVIQEKNMQMLMDSSFVVKLYATYKDARFLYFLQDAAIGGELFEIYSSEDWFGSAVHARFYAAGSALGLEHIHSRKVIYRDLKLENILLNSKGYPQLSDMGLAKRVQGVTYTVCGTADYMAPEILRRTGHNRACDWWALGIIIHLMMSGQSPFDADEPAQIYRNIVKGFRKEHFTDGMSTDLIDVVKGLCRKKPEERLPMGPKGLHHLTQAPWFQNFDWAALRRLSLQAPWTPPAKSAAELISSHDETVPGDTAAYEDDGTGWDADF